MSASIPVQRTGWRIWPLGRGCRRVISQSSSKRLTGSSVQSYVIRTRIERAQHLLLYAGMNVTEVADALGYRDIFFFSRQFKQHTGKSPSEIR
jgi:YesN/AraC family two-component response regulator